MVGVYRGKELLDTADSEDNCNLAGFGKRCSQTVAIGDQHTPLLNLEGIDREVRNLCHPFKLPLSCFLVYCTFCKPTAGCMSDA